MAPDAGEPPAVDEIELSIFGPGFGECLLVHLGQGEWLLVDSCVDQRRREQPALAYLGRIGVDAARAIKLIVTTHWHDDHVRGLADAVSTCAQARFCCPAAFGQREMLHLLGVLRRGALRDQAGTDEITRTFDTLRQRRAGRMPQVLLATPNRLLLDEPRGEGARARVVSLSPSDSAVLRATAAFAARADVDLGRALVAPTPNHSAVVLHVDLPGGSLLLGADLEESNDPPTGWTAILDLAGRPAARAQVFKVPHHGSSNGHHDRVWQDMLVEPVYTGLTPYVRGREPLPTLDDVRRIVALSDYAYITSNRRRPQPSRREQVVQKQIREVVLRMEVAEPPMGQIRFRRRMGESSPGDWAVALTGAAQELKTVA